MTKQTIGQIIESEVRKQNLSIKAFADAICCQRNNVYNIFQRDSIDIQLLKRISEVLHRNFFQDIAEDMSLITDPELSEELIERRKAVIQLHEIVPDILNELGVTSLLIDTANFNIQDSEIDPPDFGLSDYPILFFFDGSLSSRLGPDKHFEFKKIKGQGNVQIELGINKAFNTSLISIQLNYKTREEWYETLKIAFDTLRR